MSFKLYPFLLFVLGAVNVFAQQPQIKDGINERTEEVYNVGEVRGTIKRKAVYLPKPRYSREAFEAGADGTVRVEVTIDAEGSVVTAKAASGNPLLFAVSEEAARKTKFRSSAETAETSETGFLTYNFVIQAATWLRIGYDLAIIQKAPTMRPFIAPRIAKAFQPEWTRELALLGELAEMRRIEVETADALRNEKPGFMRKPVPSPSSAGQSEIRTQVFVPRLNSPTPERITIAQNLNAALQTRLAADEAALWKLNLGANLFNASLLTRNSKEMRYAAQILRQSLDNAPKSVPAETLAALRELVEIFENGRRSEETLDEVSRAISELFKTQ